MAIRSIVTRGFGNGTYSPGVALLPTRGYSIGSGAVTPFAGVVCFKSATISRASFAGPSINRATFASPTISRADFADPSITKC